MSHSNNRSPRLWRRTALAAVLLAGTALGGFAVGHAGFAATETTSRCARSTRLAVSQRRTPCPTSPTW